MKFTVQYLPLSKIKPDRTGIMTQHMRNLSGVLYDCMHLLAVRKNKKTGGYVLIGGLSRYEHLVNHTRKKYAPCLVDNSIPDPGEKTSWLKRLRKRQSLKHYPHLQLGRLSPRSLAIIRAFLRREPRFKQLTRSQQLKVLMLGIRYKQTTIQAMRHSVDQMRMKRRKTG